MGRQIVYHYDNHVSAQQRPERFVQVYGVFSINGTSQADEVFPFLIHKLDTTFWGSLVTLLSCVCCSFIIIMLLIFNLYPH